MFQLKSLIKRLMNGIVLFILQSVTNLMYFHLKAANSGVVFNYPDRMSARLALVGTSGQLKEV